MQLAAQAFPVMNFPAFVQCRRNPAAGLLPQTINEVENAAATGGIKTEMVRDNRQDGVGVRDRDTKPSVSNDGQ